MTTATLAPHAPKKRRRLIRACGDPLPYSGSPRKPIIDKLDEILVKLPLGRQAILIDMLRSRVYERQVANGK
jgi:hypothetical protein